MDSRSLIAADPQALPGLGAALVTGGSRGIGAQIAVQLAQRGHPVAVTYANNASAGEATRRACQAEGVHAVGLHFDLQQPPTAQEAVETALEEFGGLRLLILNAGIWSGGRLEATDPDRWWSVVESNLRGNQAMIRAALPALKAASAASIVLVSSAVGITGFAGDTAYASAKSAMIGLARSLAKELAPHDVRVNVLAPGFVETDMTAAVGERARERIEQRLVLSRFGRVDEVARAAVFLALDATYCTGIVLPVDGGWTL